MVFGGQGIPVCGWVVAEYSYKETFQLRTRRNNLHFLGSSGKEYVRMYVYTIYTVDTLTMTFQRSRIHIWPRV